MAEVGSVWNMAGKEEVEAKELETAHEVHIMPSKKFDSGKKRNGTVALRSQIKVLEYNHLDSFIYQEERSS